MYVLLENHHCRSSQLEIPRKIVLQVATPQTPPPTKVCRKIRKARKLPPLVPHRRPFTSRRLSGPLHRLYNLTASPGTLQTQPRRLSAPEPNGAGRGQTGDQNPPEEKEFGHKRCEHARQASSTGWTVSFPAAVQLPICYAGEPSTEVRSSLQKGRYSCLTDGGGGYFLSVHETPDNAFSRRPRQDGRKLGITSSHR